MYCPLGEEKSFFQRAFSIFTDIRKLQDKAKTSYTLIYNVPLWEKVMLTMDEAAAYTGVGSRKINRWKGS